MAKIAFCQDIMVEFMSYMYMSAVLKDAGHDVEVFFDDQTNEEDFLNELKAFKPDIVGFSILSPSASWALKLAKRVKEDIDVITAFGNVHVITNPGIIDEPGVDIACIGEGEEPVLELARRIDQGEPFHDIPALLVKHNGVVFRNLIPEKMINLDDLPFHDRDLYDKYAFFKQSKYLKFMNGRGCPFHCTFCTNPFLLNHYGAKEYIRKYTPERAIAELELLVAQRKPEFIQFIDEVFWINNKWLREFLILYKERIGVKFGGSFRFGPIKEEDVKLLAEAGADYLALATETGDEKQRLELMKKPVTNDQILRTAGLFRKYGIKFGSSAFFGLPVVSSAPPRLLWRALWRLADIFWVSFQFCVFLACSDVQSWDAFFSFDNLFSGE